MILRDGETPYFVNKRVMWMKRRKQPTRSKTLISHDLDLQLQATPSTPDQPDRISELPDEILHKILSFLPMHMAVQTSVLSKRWLHQWKHTQNVDFHTLPFSPRKPVDYTPITRCIESLESPNFPSFTIVGHVGYHSHPDVRRWVEFALSKNVHALRIGLMQISHPIKYSLLPRALFSKKRTQSLRDLFLSCVNFTPPKGITFSGAGFAYLKSLSFTYCKLADSMVGLLLLKCSALEVFVLDNCSGLQNVYIRGPNLKLKKLTFCWYFFDEEEEVQEDLLLIEIDAPTLSTLTYGGDITKLRLKNCEGLEKILLIGMTQNITRRIANLIGQLINQVIHVKILGINDLILQFLEREYRGRRQFRRFLILEHLVWYGSLNTPLAVYCLLWFIGDCPSLQSLELDFRVQPSSSFCDTVWENNFRQKFLNDQGAKYELRPGSLNNLKSVRVISFSGREGEMMLIKLLLGNAENLQKLEVLWETHVSNMTDNVLQIVIKESSRRRYTGPILAARQLHQVFTQEKITRFPRASPNVQIQFRSRWEF